MPSSIMIKRMKFIPAYEFMLFPKLAPELRGMIWHFAANYQRTITIRGADPYVEANQMVAKHNAHIVPGILHANRESREIALKHYQIHFGPQFGGRHIFFNYDVDGLYFPFPSDLDAFYGWANDGMSQQDNSFLALSERLPMEKKLKRLVIGNTIMLLGNALLRRFWRVEEVVLEAPPESFPPYTETWNNHLAALEKLWKVASKGEKTPTVKTVTTDEFMDLVHEETKNNMREEQFRAAERLYREG
ncbi:hypothetical protein F5882DRAFT_495962 [Hyaloscypha sp. PMI_1271]|nr:hypothetical protein F5882DRAFT_495962 [Hyaloscypha sp. PMI_1271]